MGLISVMGFAVIVTVLLIILRRERPELAILLSLAATALILIFLISSISRIVQAFEALALKSRINLDYLKIVVKIVGLAYLAGFGAEICRDAGESGMASKIELAGKVFILALGIPIMIGLLDVILKAF